MNTVIFIALLGFMVLWFFVHIPRSYQHSVGFVIKRNPRWLRNHPDVLAKLRNRRLATCLSYGFGVVMIILLVMGASSKKPPEYLSGIFILSTFVIIFTGIVEMSSVNRYFKLIPPPDNREVDLLRKGLSDFVPMPWVYGPLLILVGCLAVYVYAYSTEAISTDTAYVRIVGITGMLVLIGLAYLSVFHRPGYRRVPQEIQKIESYVLVASLSLCLLVGLLRIANDFFGALVFPAVYWYLAMSIVLQFAPFLFPLGYKQSRLDNAQNKADDIASTAR